MSINWELGTALRREHFISFNWKIKFVKTHKLLFNGKWENVYRIIGIGWIWRSNPKGLFVLNQDESISISWNAGNALCSDISSMNSHNNGYFTDLVRNCSQVIIFVFKHCVNSNPRQPRRTCVGTWTSKVIYCQAWNKNNNKIPIKFYFKFFSVWSCDLNSYKACSFNLLNNHESATL